MTLLIIGHDGLDYNLSKKYLASLENGSLGIMNSHYAKTVPSWTSIYTGLTREEHTIGEGKGSSWRDWLYNQVKTKITLIQPDKGPTPYQRDYRTLPFVWNDLSDAGLSVGLYGMPLTFPPFRLEGGWCVSGFPCLMDLGYITWPASIRFYMKDYTPDVLQLIDGSWVGKFQLSDLAKHKKYKELGGLHLVYEHVRRRLMNLAAIWPRFKTDVIFVGFSFVDHTGHIGITNKTQMENLYKIADYSIKAVKTIISPDKLLLVSDHGGDYMSVKVNASDPEVKTFRHTENGVYYIEGDELCGETRREYEIKEEILRLAGILK